MRTTCGVVARIASVLLLGAASSLHAQSQAIEPATTDAALRNPGDLHSSIGLRTEYQDTRNDGYRFIVTPRFQYAFDPDLAIRLETPYLIYDPGAGSARTSEPGDWRARGVWRGIRRETFAVFFATDLIIDMREDLRPGAGNTVLAPNLYASIDLPRIDAVFFPYVQHYVSLAGASEDRKVRFTTLKPDLLTIWSRGLYTLIDPNFIIDWARSARVGLTIELEIGKFLPSGFVCWLRPGIGVLNRNDLPAVYNWNLEVGTRYLF